MGQSLRSHALAGCLAALLGPLAGAPLAADTPSGYQIDPGSRAGFIHLGHDGAPRPDKAVGPFWDVPSVDTLYMAHGARCLPTGPAAELQMSGAVRCTPRSAVSHTPARIVGVPANRITRNTIYGSNGLGRGSGRYENAFTDGRLNPYRAFKDRLFVSKR